MKEDAYNRNIAARAFDVARYLLFWGIPTGVGQVTSIRTLEKQIRRMKASPYDEVRTLASEIAEACTRPPVCMLDDAASREPVAPTLAKYVDADSHLAAANADLALWARQNLSLPETAGQPPTIDLLKPRGVPADIVATLLYSVTNHAFRSLYELAESWTEARRAEVIDVALQSRTRRDELLRGFRGGLYCFDMVMDIGAYRDLHRHRRCQQFRQQHTINLGFDTPRAIIDADLADRYQSAVQRAWDTFAALPHPQGDYILPFATRSRYLFKMDFAEAEYMSRLRSGVKGHFSYRNVAWEMKCAMEELEPELGRLIEATPPWIDDPLKR